MADSANQPGVAPGPGPTHHEQGWWSPLVSVSVIGLGGPPRVRLLARMVELVLGMAFVVLTLSHSSPKYHAGIIAAAVSGLCWLGWILAGERRATALVALTILAIAGGVCGAAHNSGLLFVFVPVAATSFAFTLPIAAGECLLSLISYLITNAIASGFPGHVTILGMPYLTGVIIGYGRRQFLDRGRKAALLVTAERRADLADQERELVTERNRLGREIHDVLAHTLGAVSIQLTALDSRVKAGDDAEVLRARIRNLHSLVGDGLQEARDAVRALQDETLSLETQLGRLCALHRIVLVVDGQPRPVGADAALALYRVVQEALTNAAKHAPGAAVRVTLTYEAAAVGVAVEDSGPASDVGPLARSGGGHGLPGMRMRIELLGGHCEAGPHGGGWRVTATVPLR